MKIRFYRHDNGPLATTPPLPEGFVVSTWRPREQGLPPRDLPAWPNMAWWAFDKLGLFASPYCGVILIHHDGRLAHSSLVSPRYFRFPEMAADDLQIGGTWTDPAFRGRGLAKVAIAHVHALWSGQFERMWYIVEDDNLASIRVIDACGYSLRGFGERSVPLGLGPLATYRLTELAG